MKNKNGIYIIGVDHGYVRQCCLKKEPKSKPPDVFWELLDALYTITALLPIPEQERLSVLILRLQEAV